MPSFVSELLLAFLFVTVGFIGGAAVVMFWNERRNPSPSEPIPTRSAAAAQNTQPTAGQPPAAPNPVPNAAAPRGVRLWVDAEGGLEVELHGQPCASVQSLPLEDRQRMTALAGEWQRWLGAPLPTAPAPAPAPAAAPVPAPLPAAPAVSAAPAAAEPAKPSLSLNPLKGLMPAKKPAEPEVKAAPASIAGQIDEILQESLEKATEGTPAVRLMDDPREGVVVWVGAQKFLGVDTITDPLARKLVQTAVAEWERRNSGVKS
mgnify:FL=1